MYLIQLCSLLDMHQQLNSADDSKYISSVVSISENGIQFKRRQCTHSTKQQQLNALLSYLQETFIAFLLSVMVYFSLPHFRIPTERIRYQRQLYQLRHFYSVDLMTTSQFTLLASQTLIVEFFFHHPHKLQKLEDF